MSEYDFVYDDNEIAKREKIAEDQLENDTNKLNELQNKFVNSIAKLYDATFVYDSTFNNLLKNLLEEYHSRKRTIELDESMINKNNNNWL